MRVGVVGCGPIADSYVRAARGFPGLEFVACAGRSAASESAAALAARHGLQAMAFEAMLAGDLIDTVLVLTPAHAHVAPALAAIAAGKHVYCEKPLAGSLSDARVIASAAASRGVSLGCAPDTVLGANIQTAAAMIDAGDIGTIASGLGGMGSRGMEHWHPDPTHLYQPGGGPVMDKAPYYVAALTTLLGPVASVRADGCRAFDTRRLTAPGSPRRGDVIDVGVQTTSHGTLRFASGALVTLIVSWDVTAHTLPHLELYGTSGSVQLDDPNWFGGPVRVNAEGEWRLHETDDRPLGAPTMRDVAGLPRADYRGVGLAEMADALAAGRTPLCDGVFALHVLEVLDALVEAEATGARIDITPPDGFVAPRLDPARAAALLGRRLS